MWNHSPAQADKDTKNFDGDIVAKDIFRRKRGLMTGVKRREGERKKTAWKGSALGSKRERLIRVVLRINNKRL